MYLAHLEKLNRTRLADVLVEEGVLDRARVEEAQAEQDSTGKQLGEILIEGEVLTDYDLAKLVATHYSLPYLDVTSYSMRREVVELLPMDFRVKYAIQPLDQFGEMLTLAVAEMPSPELIGEIVESTNLTPILFVAMRRAVLNVIEEEKKRAGARSAAKAGAKAAAGGSATKSGPIPRPVATPAAPADADASLPDFDLPTVSMKLAGGQAAGRAPTAPGRTTTAKEGAGGAKAAPAAGVKPGSSAALNWMDAVSKQPGGEPAQPKLQKFPRPATAAPVTGPAAAPAPGARAPGAPAKASASPATGPAKPGAPAKEGQQGGGAWQSIFDVADESVKKTKPK